VSARSAALRSRVWSHATSTPWVIWKVSRFARDLTQAKIDIDAILAAGADLVLAHGHGGITRAG
jgi:hypothetical protein